MGARSPKRRAKPPAPTPKGRGRLSFEARVDHIAYLMIKGKWAKAKLVTLSRAWGISYNAVSKAADRASVKIELASGNLARFVVEAHLDLDAIQREARAAGAFNAAVRAIEMRGKLAGAFTVYRPGRGTTEEDGPRGLPPELARLEPPPTNDELGHFAATERPEDCQIEGCRVHGREAPNPAAVH